jgi:hypothetical protein
MVANSRAKTNNETGALPFCIGPFAIELAFMLDVPPWISRGKLPTAEWLLTVPAHCSAHLSTDGFVKVIAEKNTDKILGCHIISNVAGEILAEA